MIKFIIEVTTSKRDTNGNCYHYATVTKTDTGESISGIVGGAGNPGSHLRDLGFEFNEFKEVYSVLPIRQFDRLVKGKSYMEKDELIKFTGVRYWHLTVDGTTALCHSKTEDKLPVDRADTKVACGVWCSDCRRANYYRKIA